MPVQLLKTQDTESVLHFPLGGINVASAFKKQPNVPIDQSLGWYARTTPIAENVRSYDTEGILRGGVRSGLTKYLRNRFPGAIMGIGSVVIVDSGGAVQSSNVGRLVTNVFVANGNVRIAAAGAEGFTIPTNGTGALISTGLVFGAANGGKYFFADGTNDKYYDPSDNTVHAWVATAGSIPRDSANNRARLIVNWHGCICLAGFEEDPQNLYLSAVDNPFDWDSFADPYLATSAVVLNASPLGTIGDVITSLIPFGDDILLIGGDHTTWALQGHPNDGGRLVNISDAMGMAWGAPWCTDPGRNVYFFGSDCGIYKMDPGAGRPQPIRISQQIDPLLATVNTGANTISMIWHRSLQGFFLFCTRTAGPAAAVHLFYEARTNAWFKVTFKNPMFNPLCCYCVDGNTADDRVAIIGSWDGYVRALNPTALDDDGEPIISKVAIGPLLTNSGDQLKMLDMRVDLAEASGEVRYDIFTGKTAEAALASVSSRGGVIQAGRNSTVSIERSGYALYVQYSASVPWAMESATVNIRGLGPVLRRGVS
jgi:hypothetical protein